MHCSTEMTCRLCQKWIPLDQIGPKWIGCRRWISLFMCAFIFAMNYAYIKMDKCMNERRDMYTLSAATMQAIYMDIDRSAKANTDEHIIHFPFRTKKKNNYLFFGLKFMRNFSSTNQKCTCRMWHSHFMQRTQSTIISNTSYPSTCLHDEGMIKCHHTPYIHSVSIHSGPFR